MNTTCRACLNYTENGVRLLTLYKNYNYLPIIIMNCTGIKVDDSENDHKLPLCTQCADKLLDINEFRTMYLESHDKLKKNLKECLKYSPNDQKQPLNNNNSTHEMDADGKNSGMPPIQAVKGAKIKISADDAYANIIIDETQLMHQSNNKENNIVDIAMNMAGGTQMVGTSQSTTTNSTVHAVANGPTKKAKATRQSKSRKKANQQQQQMVQMTQQNHNDANKQMIYESDPNLLDMNNGNGTDASELQYIILQSDTKIFSCSNCEQQFISEDFLKQHMQKAHPIITELVQTPALSPMSLNQQVPTIYLCHFCENKQFTSEIQLSHHMYIHSEITAGALSSDPFPYCSCEHCLPLQGETEKMIIGDGTEAELVAMHQQMEDPMHHQQQQQHQQQQHHQQQQQQHQHQQQAPMRQVVQTASGKHQTLYSCSVCNKSTFKTEHRLKKHMRIHRNEQPFSCDICHKVYNASSSLKTHQRMVHGGANNSTATTITTTATTLNQTIDNSSGIIENNGQTKIVTNDAGHILCSICNKTFTKTQQLIAHMKSAHGDDADKMNEITME